MTEIWRPVVGFEGAYEVSDQGRMSECALHLDFETRSVVDLPKANVYIYAESPTTDVWCAAYAFGNEDPRLWVPGEPCPDDIFDHVLAGGEIHAFNAAFERIIWREVIGPKHGWPVPKLTQYRCTMVRALAMALPASLDQAAPALGLETVKDQAGRRLMLQMSKPRRPKKGEPKDVLRWWDDDPEKLQRLYEYCRQDVRTEVAVSERLFPLSPAEQTLWVLDQEINDRGVFIDEKLCLAAKRVVASAESRLDKELQKLTDFAVQGVSNTQQLTTWLKTKGVRSDGVAKDVVEALLIRDDLAPDVRRALEIRQEGGKTSVAKIDAMLKRRQKDGRMRGNLQFCGAGSTRRWAGRGAQLQNLPRPSEEFEGEDKDTLVQMIMDSKDDRLIEALYGNTLTIVADCVRGMIAAEPGNDIIAADFEEIEARVNPWLAGEEWKLKAFRAYDAGEGPKLYTVSAAGIYGCTPGDIQKGSTPYMVGKVSELALGYQGGPGALAKMAKNYKFDVGSAAESVNAAAAPEHIEAAAKAWESRGKKSGMAKVRWLTAEVIKLAYRARNPNIQQFWWDLEAGAIEAVKNPGKQVVVGKTGRVAYKRVGSWLFCKLPSGGILTYPYPKLVQKETPWGEFRDALEYKGVNGVTRKWETQHFYGGLACNNVTQGTARDRMVVGMKAAAAAGYPLTLTVHDELVAEVRKDFGTLDEFNALMTTPAGWDAGLPIAADGWRAGRYRK